MADLGELNRCRLCSSQNNLTDIFGSPNEELLRMVYACTSILISFEKDFPCAVCSSCIRIVKQFYAYRQKCLDHNRQLKRMRGETDDDGEERSDPLKVDSKKQKKDREARDRQFYEEVRKQIQSFLETQVKEVERKALEKVDEALKKRKSKRPSEEVLLQMVVEPADEVGEAIEYNVMSESEECCKKQDGSEMDCKLELESVYFELSDPEEMAESSFAGFDQQSELDGCSDATPVKDKVVSPKKRKWSSDASTDISNHSKVLEQQLTEAQQKIDTLMQLNYDLGLKRMRLKSSGGVVSKKPQKSNAMTMNSRGKNWSTHEDEQLCRSWLHVLKDPILGSDQLKYVFWQTIKSHAEKSVPEISGRPVDSLRQRFGTISHLVSTFVGCLASVERASKSGTETESDKLQAARDAYLQETHKKRFKIQGCYEILKDEPKFANVCE